MPYQIITIIALCLLCGIFIFLFLKERKQRRTLQADFGQERSKLNGLYRMVSAQNEKLRIKELELYSKNEELKSKNLQMVNDNRELSEQKELIHQQQRELQNKSEYLARQMAEIAMQNEQLHIQKEHIREQHDEISAINDELKWHNQIMEEANEKMREQHTMITDSIRYARDIQQAMLPPPYTISESFPEHFIFFQPRELVSGDFYWYAKKDEFSIIAAVDCTGHGVPGAFMSMIANGFLRKVILEEGEVRPDVVLELLHTEIRNTLHQDESRNMDGLDMALCVWNENTRKLWYAGAKNPLWIEEEGQLKVVRATRRPIGGLQWGKEIHFRCHEIHIQRPTMCYIFSDGFPDQFGGAEGRKYLSQNFKAFLQGICHHPMEQQHKLIRKELFDWMGGNYGQIDDILVVGFRLG